MSAILFGAVPLARDFLALRAQHGKDVFTHHQEVIQANVVGRACAGLQLQTQGTQCANQGRSRRSSPATSDVLE